MLRITLEDNPNSVKFNLAGKLSGAWVDELEHTWHSLVGATPNKAVTVDLSQVTYIDGQGKRLLGEMFQQGAEFRAAYLMTKYIVEEITRSGSRTNGSSDQASKLNASDGKPATP